jgi:phosphatidylethanolamine N-methyltransferase
MLVLILGYSLASWLLPGLSPRMALAVHYIHALSWVLIHYVGLGLLLRAQSENKFLVRHFLTNYHYPEKDAGQGAIIEAFNNWKVLYNLTLCMTYGS